MKKFIAVSAVALGATLSSTAALAVAPANLVWTDANTNGIIDAGELADTAGVAATVSASQVTAGAYNGSYANLATTTTALNTSLSALQANITKYQAALAVPSTAATANAVADLKTLAKIRTAYIAYANTVVSSPNPTQQLAMNAAAAEYTAVLSASKFNNTALQTQLTTNGVAFDSNASTNTALATVENGLLTQVKTTDTAYATALTNAGVTLTGVTTAGAFATALTGVETTLKAAQTSAATYQSQLTAVTRSTTLLAAGAASKSAYVKNAAAALTSPTAGVNYETEVLGALADHDTRIVSLEALTSEHTRQIADLNGRVDRLDEKVASSTATAIAMGGGAFLPDMKFNLSANVATYDGAQAIAASLGYRVSDNFAVTASVGGGLNKGGKVGGRVGFIFGW